MGKKNFVFCLFLILSISVVCAAQGVDYDNEGNIIHKNEPVYVDVMPGDNLNDISGGIDIVNGEDNSIIYIIMGISIILAIIIFIVIFRVLKKKNPSNAQVVNKKLVGIFLFIFLGLFLISFVDAENAFKTSGPTNAHAGTMASAYGHTILLDHDILGDTNNQLWLVADTNSHVSTTSTERYNMGIDLGQVYHTCSLNTGGSSCPTGKECIIEMSGSTNAHVADCGSNLYDAFCCDYYFCGDEIVTASIGEGCDGTNLNGISTCEEYSAGTVGTLTCDSCSYSGCSLLNCPDVPGCVVGTPDANECDGTTKYDCEMDVAEECIEKVNEVDCTTSGDICLDESGCVDCVDDDDCSLPSGKNPGDLVDGTYYCNGAITHECRDYYDSAPNPICTEDNTCQIDITPVCEECALECDSGTGRCNEGCEVTDTEHYQKCYNGDVYWYDNCDGLQALVVDCGSSSCVWDSWSCPTGSIWTRSKTGIDYYCDEISVSCKTKACSGSGTVNCGTDNQICGESATECITAIYWADMNGDILNPAKAQIGDSVLMVYEQEGDYTSLTFDIYENDLDLGTGLADDEIKTGIESFELNGRTVAKWEITTEDLTKTSDYQEFEFRVDSKTSGYLEIIITESNSRPSITIAKPVDGGEYTIDYNSGDETEAIEFEQFSSDVDDDLKVIWDFGDGSESDWFENCLTGGDCDTTHKYDASGTKTIFATAEEMTRGQSAIDYSNIYVYKIGINVFSKIASPIVEGRVVQMDGSDSFVCECTDIEQTGAGWYKINQLSGPNLWCKNFIIEEDYDFIFQWVFDKGTNDEETKIGMWSTDYYDVVEFTHFFPDLGVHTVELDVGYIAN